MDIGMPTLLEHRNLGETVALCKSLNLNFIELNMNLPEYQVEKLDVNKMNEYREKEGIYFTFHMDENLNVCDLNKRIAEVYTKTVLDTITIAKKVKAPVINMHMTNGVYFTLPEKKVYLFSQYYNRYMNKLTEFRDKCEKAIGSSNIRICIENEGGYESFTKDGIEVLLESKVFALTFDIGHNYCARKVDEPFIKQNINKLYHMHIHDAIGKKDHLVLGQGEIHLAKKFMLADACDCRVVLEAKTTEALKETVSILPEYYCDGKLQ